MEHHAGAQSQDIASLNIEGVNAYLQDVVVSNDPNAPISAAFLEWIREIRLNTYTATNQFTLYSMYSNFDLHI